MGDVARQQLCEKFVDEFGKELLEKFQIKAHWVVSQEVQYDPDNYIVRLHVYAREDNGDETFLTTADGFFNPSMTEEDTVNELAGFLSGDRDTEDDFEALLSSLRERVKKVFS